MAWAACGVQETLVLLTELIKVKIMQCHHEKFGKLTFGVLALRVNLGFRACSLCVKDSAKKLMEIFFFFENYCLVFTVEFHFVHWCLSVFPVEKKLWIITKIVLCECAFLLMIRIIIYKPLYETSLQFWQWLQVGFKIWSFTGISLFPTGKLGRLYILCQ